MRKPQPGSKPSDEPRNRPVAAYEKPRIIFREPLEAVAAACLPTPPGKSEGVCAITSS